MSSGGATTNTMTQQQQLQVTAVQSNGGTKKIMSGGNSSGGPTPVATPVQNGTGQGPSPPPSTNAPKYGTLVPNRIFVGGIAANTTETELMQLFSEYGPVKAAKIIQDRAGVSKGYGFITFETEDDARRPLRNPDNIMLRERRLNIAPAIKKQPFGRPTAAPPYDSQITVDGRSPAPPPHQAALQPPMPPIFFGSPPQFYTGATAYYAPPVPSMVSSAQAQVQVSQASQEQPNQQAAVYQAPPVYPTQTGPHQTAPYASMMFPQAIYMPQQYPMVPYEYSYGVVPGAPPTNGMPPNFATTGTPPGGGASPPRGPCYAPAPGPPEILYGPGPPHHLFHPTLDPAGAGHMYAPADGTFDPMGPHPTMASFGPMGGPFGISEDGTFLDRPSTSATPRSVLTATPPSEQRSAATPVVSVLGLDQQQEKDPAAMQGGRRPPAPQPQQNAQRRGPAPTGNRRPYGRPPNMQHFQPPQPNSFMQTAQRRPRKPQRRGTAVHGTPNEIGAGDAPLPNQDDGLAAQVEALKI